MEELDILGRFAKMHWEKERPKMVEKLKAMGIYEKVLQQVEVEAKYAGYIARDRERADSLRQRDQHPLPEDADYLAFGSVSWEARQKLERVRPASLGQAARIPGISPSDLQNLLVEIRKRAPSGVARETPSDPSPDPED